MKKYFERLMVVLLAMTAFTACTKEEGQAPGNDAEPKVTLYQYAASGNLNPDNDMYVRIAANNKVSEVYYLVELASDKQARNMSEEAYADYVIKNGTKLADVAGKANDVIVKDLHGVYEITVVGVTGNKKLSVTDQFAGLNYKPIGKGHYTSEFFGDEWDVDVEWSDVDNRYRIIDNWYEGYGLVFNIKGSKATCIPTTTKTGYSHPTYGMVSVTDTGSSYDEKTKVVTFGFKWTVSVGSFGVYYDTLTLP